MDMVSTERMVTVQLEFTVELNKGCHTLEPRERRCAGLGWREKGVDVRRDLRAELNFTETMLTNLIPRHVLPSFYLQCRVTANCV